MAASFSISDSESEPSESQEVEQAPREQAPHRHQLTLSGLREAGGRIRLSSESQVCDEARVEEELGTPTDGFPFRGRSKSAPPVLWAAKKYGQQLRRMSDEFDSLLDKGEMKKMKNSRPIQHSKTWWSYLFSHQETEGENNHHDSQRTE